MACLQLSEVIALMTSELDKEKSALTRTQQYHSECQKRVFQIEQKIKDQGRDRDSLLKDLEKRIKSMKKEAVAATKELKVCSNAEHLDRSPFSYFLFHCK